MDPYHAIYLSISDPSEVSENRGKEETERNRGKEGKIEKENIKC